MEAASVQNNALLQDSKNINACGAWEPIKNIEDPYVQEIGRFAVMEHDNQTGEHIDFFHVVSGKTQVVAGINYGLEIKATRNGEKMFRFYEAVVWDKPWERTWTLISFKPLPIV